MTAQDPERLTKWTCLTCGVIGDAQSCWSCGGEAMPGEWVLAAEHASALAALTRIAAGDRNPIAVANAALGTPEPWWQARTGRQSDG